MNLTNEASCPIMLRLHVIVVGGTFLFSKISKNVHGILCRIDRTWALGMEEFVAKNSMVH